VIKTKIDLNVPAEIVASAAEADLILPRVSERRRFDKWDK